MRNLLLCMVLLMIFSPAAVNAHQIFVRPISGYVNIGDVAILPVAAGHNTSSSEMPEGLTNLTIMRQDGGLIDHIVNEKTDTMGNYPIFSFDVERPGLYVITSYNGGGAWTHIITNPPATAYWEAGTVDEIDFDAIDKTGWAKDWYVERSYPLHTYGKSFIAGPDSDYSIASKPVGQILEVVPLTNITEAGNGEFQFQVLYQGQPFSDIELVAQKVGDDTKLRGMTDAEGKVSLNLSTTDEFREWVVVADTLMDTRVVEAKDAPRGEDSNEKTFVGPVYRATLVLRTDFLKPEE
ncbi:MAG: DUF4198 domain-containing protein [Methanothrix sp.]|nr:DUF4198 domain-containing protein [Methanothrix sp.]